MSECYVCGYSDWAVFHDHAICGNCGEYYCFIVEEDIEFGKYPIYGDKNEF